MALPEQEFQSETAYLEMERESDIRHEYIDGFVRAMAGASEAHNTIGVNLVNCLHSQLRKQSCRFYASDMRVKISSSKSYTYPDISVVCAKPQFEDEIVDTLLNPILIIEILSPSTESYDRGLKFQHYRTLESLQEYVLISQDAPHIETYLRQGERWLLTDFIGLQSTAQLTSINCYVPLSEVYDLVEFEPKDTENSQNNDTNE